ncbi:MAG TPA: S-methyl-5'-thioadenosine phosphorylase, partial [Thermodesulfobacteriota bacterium]|nr:S-methyl-5'-thioadenosine phosphorylase [Thermodesulfobacteriota bacterium]
VGVIGGSGLYEMEGLEDLQTITLKTPFGEPSDAYIVGHLEGVKVVFLPRHGKGHRIQPSSVNFRANIFGMKKLGAEWIIGVSAVGSMKESIHPGDMVIPNQFIDQTKGRPSTFFSDGIVGHISFADPVCPVLSRILFEAGKEVGAAVQKDGTYICIEGPQFSTRAESRLYRTWGVDVIGMTNIPEAKLAREAEICYSTIAFATDYDCWHESAEDVSIGEVLRILAQSTKIAKSAIRLAIKRLPEKRDCLCSNALKYAMITAKKFIPEKTKKDLEPIIEKYIKAERKGHRA